MNLVILSGRLGKNPETSYTQGGVARTKFSFATSTRYKDKSGDQQEQTQWHNVIVWGKRAEHVAKYLSKGSFAIVRGSIEYLSWDDQKTGEKKYMTQIKADEVEFGPKSGGGQMDGGRGSGNGVESGGGGGYGDGGYSGGYRGQDDDIPF